MTVPIETAWCSSLGNGLRRLFFRSVILTHYSWNRVVGDGLLSILNLDS